MDYGAQLYVSFQWRWYRATDGKYRDKKDVRTTIHLLINDRKHIYKKR